MFVTLKEELNKFVRYFPPPACLRNKAKISCLIQSLLCGLYWPVGF